MCHLILLMPVLALPIMWLLPLSLAAPLYMVIVGVSGLIYWLIGKSMGRQPATGAESLIGAEAEVVSRLGSLGHAQYLVRCQGELWSANCSTALQPGETVNVAAVDGVRLVIQQDNSSSLARKQTGERANEWHCH